MQTIKTAIVVVLMLVVLYGAYEVLNRPAPEPPEEVSWIDEDALKPPEIDFDMGGFEEPVSPVPASPTAPGQIPMPPADSHFLDDPNSSPYHTDPNTTHRAPPDAEPGAGYDSQSRYAAPPQVSGDYQPPFGDQVVPPSAGATNPPSYADESQSVQVNPYATQAIVPQDTQTSVTRAFDKAWKSAQRDIENERYHEALTKLTIFYKSPDLTVEEDEQLLDVLDPLAAKVIYSREHLVEPAYEVRRNETLMTIADQYQVPWQLLQKINGVDSPRVLVPGTQLKVVSGPFHAQVHLADREMTLFVNDLYAGRFPVSLGTEPAPREGDYAVRAKQTDRDYFTYDGRMIAAGRPENPFGRHWMDLGNDLGIHGTGGAATPSHGCVSLSPRDAEDVYDILSVGSTVRILQ